MGRKGSWFSAVKKVFSNQDSKKDQKSHKSKVKCFGGHYEEPEPASEEAPIAVVPSLPPIKDKKLTKADNEQNKQAFTLALATAVAAVQAAAEVARLTSMPRYPGKTNEEVAAIKIQTVFRGYMARRSLRALKGFERLKTLIEGQPIKRQTVSTLRSMQSLTRLQSQVHVRRIRVSEENHTLQRQLQQKREKELENLQAFQVGEKWDDSMKSKEQIESKLLNRQVAAMRRERALAYASTHQQTWKKSANQTFMDLKNPHWGWSWLERWMAERPWEVQSSMYNNDHASVKSTAARHTISVGEITKLYRDRDHDRDHHDSKADSSASQKTSKATSLQFPNGIRKARMSSPKGSANANDDSRSMFSSVQSERYRRHSIAGSSSVMRDDESIASSSPAFQRNLSKAPNTKSSVAKGSSISRVKSPSSTENKGAAVNSAKKRLSYPASSSAAGSRRNNNSDTTNEVEMVSNNKNNLATVTEEKEKLKVKVKVNSTGSR